MSLWVGANPSDNKKGVGEDGIDLFVVGHFAEITNGFQQCKWIFVAWSGLRLNPLELVNMAIVVYKKERCLP